MAISILLVAAVASHAGPQDYFAIEVVDADTGRGVPLIELTTTNGITHVTDSAGLVAFDEPGLMGRAVWFTVKGHGYEAKADGFGFRGVRLETKAGGSARIEVKRLNIAERLYRITGQGVYADSVKLGRGSPIEAPVINAGVMGQDSAQVVVYRGKGYWFWGDTNLPGYPLGHFGMAGATVELKGLDPSAGLNLRYFVDEKGLSRATFDLGKPGPVWADGVFVVPDADGRERMVCHYSRMKDLGTVLEHGIAVWDDDAEMFKPVVDLPLDSKLHSFGHAFRHTVDGVEWMYFADPYAKVRIPPTYEAAIDPRKYEAVDGAPPDEGATWPVDADGGEVMKLHRGSINWNAYRKKWVMIAGRYGGERSFIGDIYYLEADSPLGPWAKGKCIVTHDKYSFYNPVHHAFLDGEGGRFIYFEGTYTHTFSGTPGPGTPRYDYNQIMYRLDLGDERLRGGGGEAE